MSEPYRLLGAEVSYFTGKARAYLENKAIPFAEIVATRDVYRGEILPRVGWPVVPVVITPDDETLQDTTEIIDTLEQTFNEPSVYPPTPRQLVASLLLEVYGDEWLVLPAMHYRWHYCRDWAFLEFGKMSAPNESEDRQRAIGAKNGERFAGSLSFLGINGDTEATIESSYRELLADLNHHFERHRYIFGERPTIGDYGLIGPLYAHLYRDPHPGEIMRREAPAVAAWVERMQRPTGRIDGPLLADDEVPETLLPILRRQATEQLPVLVDTTERVARWLDQHDDDEIPRAIGMHPFTLARGTSSEVTSQRAVLPYSQWMFQRPIDAFAALEGAERQACAELLAEVGALEALSTEIRRRVARRRFRLVRTRETSRSE